MKSEKVWCINLLTWSLFFVSAFLAFICLGQNWGKLNNIYTFFLSILTSAAGMYVKQSTATLKLVRLILTALVLCTTKTWVIAISSTVWGPWKMLDQRKSTWSFCLAVIVRKFKNSTTNTSKMNCRVTYAKDNLWIE